MDESDYEYEGSGRYIVLECWAGGLKVNIERGGREGEEEEAEEEEEEEDKEEEDEEEEKEEEEEEEKEEEEKDEEEENSVFLSLSLIHI